MDKELLVNLLNVLKAFCNHYANDKLITKEKLDQYMQIHIDKIIKLLE